GEAKTTAADVIWDLSANSNTISVIRDSGAITNLVELLSHGSEEAKLNVSGAFSQLSYSESGRMALADAGA
ncbi:U-box domain-containing protein 4-like, partial [Trifolium medium]|nr:U-box domain-containing protein 4-like [Trifolium medium]